MRSLCFVLLFFRFRSTNILYVSLSIVILYIYFSNYDDNSSDCPYESSFGCMQLEILSAMHFNSGLTNVWKQWHGYWNEWLHFVQPARIRCVSARVYMCVCVRVYVYVESVFTRTDGWILFRIVVIVGCYRVFFLAWHASMLTAFRQCIERRRFFLPVCVHALECTDEHRNRDGNTEIEAPAKLNNNKKGEIIHRTSITNHRMMMMLTIFQN